MSLFGGPSYFCMRHCQSQHRSDSLFLLKGLDFDGSGQVGSLFTPSCQVFRRLVDDRRRTCDTSSHAWKEHIPQWFRDQHMEKAIWPRTEPGVPDPGGTTSLVLYSVHVRWSASLRFGRFAAHRSSVQAVPKKGSTMFGGR